MTVSVSPASESDLPALADLAAQTFPLACPPELSTHAVEEFIAMSLSTGALHTHLGAPGHDLLCARNPAGDLVGYALLIAGTEMDPDCAGQIEGDPTVGISKFYVDPDQHGSAVAGILLDRIEALAATRGARSLWLGTNTANGRARRFYERNGFVQRGGRTFVVGGVANTDVVYEKAL